VSAGAQDGDCGDRPSKSERKRAAHAAQDLGEALIGLRDAELEALGLPERLADAIRDARTIPGRGGGARQRQYIGKLMREIDLEPIRAALRAQSEEQACEAQLFKRVEAWRERLIREGAGALDELQRWRPEIDRADWLRRIEAARAERTGGRGTAAGRELFRALRGLFSGQPGTMDR
jgi:ribosome-associated protein